MTFGEKVKIARKNADMTQAELAGDFITRNMLSKIEHDVVMPSLQTLMYLARRLHVSPAWLLSDEVEHTGEFDFYTSEVKTLFAEGQIDKCLEMCARITDDSSDEIDLIRSICHLRRGERRFSEGWLDAAKKDFEDVLRFSARTAYASADIIRKGRIMLEEISKIENREISLIADDCSAEDNAPFRTVHEQLYAERIIEIVLSKRKIAAAEQLVGILLPEGSVSERKMRARVCEEAGDISGAIDIMRDLAEDESICDAERCLIWGHLERLYAAALEYGQSYACARIRDEMYTQLYPGADETGVSESETEDLLP